MTVLVTGCANHHRGNDATPPRTSAPPARRPARKPPVTPAPPRVVHRTLIAGQSVSGEPIEMHIFGDGPETVLIFGGIHGNEPTSADLAARLVRHLAAHPEIAADRRIVIMPATNPDGLAARTRGNARGVDVNRNFPAGNWRRATGGRTHGARPASEPETRAIIAAVETMQPVRIVSIHSIRRGRHCNNYDGPAAGLAQAMARHNGYPVEPTMGYPTPGSFGSWAGIDQRIPTITLELPRDLSAADCWRENAAALLAFIDYHGAGD
jgi:protein MpaA